MPGQTPLECTDELGRYGLQWRAGQLPGQTLKDARLPGLLTFAFNGGPDNCPARPPPLSCLRVERVLPSMEGRTIARPDQIRKVTDAIASLPSMEGRTIARPDSTRPHSE